MTTPKIIVEWTTPKVTVNEALGDAEDVLEKHASIGVSDYMRSMEAAHVTPSAARATLRYLEGKGRVAVEDLATIRIHKK